MRFIVFAVCAFGLSSPAFAQVPGLSGVATVPGAIAGGKVSSFDASKKVMVVEANGTKTSIDISKAVISGQIAVGAIVDVTHNNGVASAIAVRSGAQQPASSVGGGVASAPGAISGATVSSFDAAKKIMVLDVNGQKIEINVANAVVTGQIAPGKVVDVSHSNNVASAVAVRP